MLTKISFDAESNLSLFTGPLEQALWVDAFNPTLQERLLLEKEVNIFLPSHNEMHQIEFSNRYYYENNALYLYISVITKAAPIPESHMVTFVLTKERLVTLRYSDPNPLKSYMDQLGLRKNIAHSSFEVLFLLLNLILGKAADAFELIGERTDELAQNLSETISHSSSEKVQRNLHMALKEINVLESLLSKGFQSLTSLGYLISYLKDAHHKLISENLMDNLATINQDTQSMLAHGKHLSEKLSFLLQSTLGLIGMEQSNIIKTFTVLAMVFMPPTLIASIYGMNFHNIPELSWYYGYPLALMLMVASAFLPYRFFRRKGWI